MRDGRAREFQATGATEEEARRELERRADARVPIKADSAPDMPDVPSRGSTLLELAELWPLHVPYRYGMQWHMWPTCTTSVALTPEA